MHSNNINLSIPNIEISMPRKQSGMLDEIIPNKEKIVMLRQCLFARPVIVLIQSRRRVKGYRIEVANELLD
jgi:hypothetical protein